ncbi:MAG: hypothetical protein U5R14_07730 [Gemmatimonadota bacterium]|nr:hypothetical protein [Gemmatimonadota bacterium]
MKPLPPSWAMGAHALDGAGDPHLQPGAHFRLATAPVLGLPLRPLLVYKHRLHPGEANEAMQTEIRWTDSAGRTLTPPFDVTPDNPVTGHLPVSQTRRCIWIEVAAESPSDRARNPGGLTRNLDADIRRTIDRVDLDAVSGPIRLRRDILDLVRRLPDFVFRPGLKVDAFLESIQGMSFLGSRTEAPYVLSASSLSGVVVSGTGRVQGARWLEWGRTRTKRALWRVLPMPVSSGPRHLAPSDARDQALERVRRGAPRRYGLHDRPETANAASAPAATVGAEERRVTRLSEDLEPSLEALVNDTSAAPLELGIDQELDQSESDQVAAARYPALGTVLLSALDPGVARWLGFMDRDEDDTAPVGSIVIYTIRGFWSVDWNALSLWRKLAFFPAASAGIVSSSQPPDGSVPFDIPRRSPDGTPVFDLEVPAVATIGVPPDAPTAPVLEPPVAPEGAPDADPMGVWMPGTPGSYRRHVQMPVRDLVPGACLAVAREHDGTRERLNRTVLVDPGTGEERAMSLHAALPGSADSADQGSISDREAHPDATEYHAAQADWFGRWSAWRARTIGPKEPPAPPIPVIQPRYEMAETPDPMHDDPLWGRLSVRVPVPPATDLAPGSHPLDRIRIEGTVAGATTESFAVEEPVPSAPGPHLEVEIPVPTGSGGTAAFLARTEIATATMTARWIDADGGLSEPTEPRELDLVDPRPPEPVTIDPTLTYTARPDATGRALARIGWTASSTQHGFRVYFSDETRLVERMESVAAGSGSDASTAQAFLDDLAAAGGPAERAAAFTAPGRPEQFRRDWFENLTGDLLVGSGDMRFQHDLSASLRSLAFYRVVAVSETNVESEFAGSPLVPRAVPNSGPPPRPMIEVVPRDRIPDDVTVGEQEVLLRVRVVRGAQPVSRVRLRRSSRGGGDALRMPVALETDVTPSEPGPDGIVTVDLVDTGAYNHEPGRILRPFSNYFWRVEVQAPNEPGSSLPGEWSPPSDATSTLLVGPRPGPVTGLAAAASPPPDPVVTLTWEHPEPLLPGGIGGFRFEILRRQDGREKVVGQLAADADPAAGGRSGPGDSFTWTETLEGADPAEDLEYRVVTLDPLGRRGPVSSPVSLP